MITRSKTIVSRALGHWGRQPSRYAVTSMPSSRRLQSTTATSLDYPSETSFPPSMASTFSGKTGTVEPIRPSAKFTTMPPNYNATVADLSTFSLPVEVRGDEKDIALGKAMIAAWRKDGILQVSMDQYSRKLAAEAFAASQRYFGLSPAEKQTCVDDRNFAGYIASGEEITDGKADYSEIFTVVKDLPQTDKRVQAQWPCHGPVPWPETLPEFQDLTQRYMDNLGSAGERLLQLIALGLDLPSKDALTKYTRDGWHHMRVLRFPALGTENGKGETGRGIGSHTDYGLLVIAAQDHVGGLFIRPPYQDEKFANWEKSNAGMNEKDDKWTYVEPQEGVFTVFPGNSCCSRLNPSSADRHQAT